MQIRWYKAHLEIFVWKKNICLRQQSSKKCTEDDSYDVNEPQLLLLANYLNGYTKYM